MSLEEERDSHSSPEGQKWLSKYVCHACSARGYGCVRWGQHNMECKSAFLESGLSPKSSLQVLTVGSSVPPHRSPV